jgi:hypothetical protein
LIPEGGVEGKSRQILCTTSKMGSVEFIVLRQISSL